MLNNFHEIKAVISSKQSFKASFYGMAEYVHGMINNRFKFNNPILQVKLYFQSRTKNNKIKFENSTLYTTLLSALKPQKNIIKFNNEIKTKLFLLVKSKDKNIITVLNKPIQKLSILFSPKLDESNFKFENNKPKVELTLDTKVESNNLYFDNNNESGIHSIVSLVGTPNENKILFQNSAVNASASFFVRLEAMSGSLNAYYNQTINDTGRKKIV